MDTIVRNISRTKARRKRGRVIAITKRAMPITMRERARIVTTAARKSKTRTTGTCVGGDDIERDEEGNHDNEDRGVEMEDKEHKNKEEMRTSL